MCENQENKQDFYTINLPVMVGCALPTLQTVVFGGFSQLSPGYLDSFCKKMAEMSLRNHQLLVRKQWSYGVKSQMSETSSEAKTRRKKNRTYRETLPIHA